jgi:hypothetical protein
MSGRWFHASRSVNRESIALLGLDWRRMLTVPGIAGSANPEREGVFLCRTLTDVVWFAGMVGSESVDIWAAQLEEVWLEADAGGGVDMGWAICHQPIPPDAVELQKTHPASS